MTRLTPAIHAAVEAYLALSNEDRKTANTLIRETLKQRERLKNLEAAGQLKVGDHVRFKGTTRPKRLAWMKGEIISSTGFGKFGVKLELTERVIVSPATLLEKVNS